MVPYQLIFQLGSLQIIKDLMSKIDLLNHLTTGFRLSEFDRTTEDILVPQNNNCNRCHNAGAVPLDLSEKMAFDAGKFGDLLKLSKIILPFENKPLPSLDEINYYINEETATLDAHKAIEAGDSRKTAPKDRATQGKHQGLSSEAKLLLKSCRTELNQQQLAKVTSALQLYEWGGKLDHASLRSTITKALKRRPVVLKKLMRALDSRYFTSTNTSSSTRAVSKGGNSSDPPARAFLNKIKQIFKADAYQSFLDALLDVRRLCRANDQSGAYQKLNICKDLFDSNGSRAILLKSQFEVLFPVNFAFSGVKGLPNVGEVAHSSAPAPSLQPPKPVPEPEPAGFVNGGVVIPHFHSNLGTNRSLSENERPDTFIDFKRLNANYKPADFRRQLPSMPFKAAIASSETLPEQSWGNSHSDGFSHFQSPNQSGYANPTSCYEDPYVKSTDTSLKLVQPHDKLFNKEHSEVPCSDARHPDARTTETSLEPTPLQRPQNQASQANIPPQQPFQQGFNPRDPSRLPPQNQGSPAWHSSAQMMTPMQHSIGRPMGHQAGGPKIFQGQHMPPQPMWEMQQDHRRFMPMKQSVPPHHYMNGPPHMMDQRKQASINKGAMYGQQPLMQPSSFVGPMYQVARPRGMPYDYYRGGMTTLPQASQHMMDRRQAFNKLDVPRAQNLESVAPYDSSFYAPNHNFAYGSSARMPSMIPAIPPAMPGLSIKDGVPSYRPSAVGPSPPITAVTRPSGVPDIPEIPPSEPLLLSSTESIPRIQQNAHVDQSNGEVADAARHLNTDVEMMGAHSSSLDSFTVST